MSVSWLNITSLWQTLPGMRMVVLVFELYVSLRFELSVSVVGTRKLPDSCVNSESAAVSTDVSQLLWTNLSIFNHKRWLKVCNKPLQPLTQKAFNHTLHGDNHEQNLSTQWLHKDSLISTVGSAVIHCSCLSVLPAFKTHCNVSCHRAAVQINAQIKAFLQRVM